MPDEPVTEVTAPSPLPPAFAPSPPQIENAESTIPSAPTTDPSAPKNTLSEEDINAVLNEYKAEWDQDPEAEIVDMSKIVSIQNAQMSAKAPAQGSIKQEWSLITHNPARPELDHRSDNPFDFLPNAKLEKLIRFWRGEPEATDRLTTMETNFLAEPRMKKVLAKVVNVGSPTIDNDRKCAWIRSAITSAIIQSGIKTNNFDKLRIAINPAKQGYTWIIIPVRAPVFKELMNIRAALDPRSGTLVLLRAWKEASFPTQHFFAFGIHNLDDSITLEIAIADYREQMQESLAANNITILSMNSALYGDSRRYSVKIKFGFVGNTTPFLINPQNCRESSGQV